MMLPLRLTLVLLAGLSLIDRVHAVEPPLDQKDATVVIKGQREELEKQVFEFVKNITRSDSTDDTTWEGSGSLRRWNQPVCPLVAGLGKEQSEFLLARLSTVARTAHVPLGAEKCQPNLYVVFTSDPQKLIDGWRKRDGRAFDVAQITPKRDFTEKDRPVRVWYNASLTAANGMSLNSGSPFDLGANRLKNTNQHAIDSRIKFTDVHVLDSVLVIINSNRLEGVQYGQLADYVAMVGFAEVYAYADIGSAPSILQLFAARTADQSAPGGLTNWDEAFLSGLYGTSQASTMQRSAITRVMLDTVSR